MAEIVGAEEAYTTKAVALVRALGRVSSNVEGYQEFARRVCLSVPCAKEASILLSGGNYLAISKTGQEAVSSLKGNLQEFLTFSHPAGESLRKLEDSLDYAMTLLAESEKALYSRWDSMPDILSSTDATAFATFHTELLQAMCYSAALRYGIEPLEPLRTIELGSMEKSFDALLEARELLSRAVGGRRSLGTWLIAPTPKGDGLFSDIAGYTFSLSCDKLETLLKPRTFKRVAPNLYVTDDSSTPSIVGEGYVIGTDFRTSYKLRDEKAHGKLPSYAFEDEPFNFDDPLGSVRRYFSNDDAFCFHPEELASAIDRRERARSLSRSSARVCPACGKAAQTPLFCQSGRRG